MGSCSSAKKSPSKPDRAHRETDQVLCSAASEGVPQALPAARELHSFQPCSDFDPAQAPSRGTTLHSKPTASGVPSILQDSRISVSCTDDEEVLITRLAGGMHRLGRAYQRERSFLESLKWLRSSWELYEYLGLKDELLRCEGDIALAHIAEGTAAEFHPSEYAEVAADPRIAFLVSAVRTISNSTRPHELTSIINRARELDTPTTESSLLDALLETAHMLRLWLNDYLRALSLYEQALSLEPEKLQIYLFLGMTQKALGNVDECVKCYKQALALDQHYAEAWVNLGNVYFEEVRDYTHAEKCYTQALKALERGQDSMVSAGKVYNLLSEVFFEQGFVLNALESSMKGIGVDSMCIDNFTAASEYAEKLGMQELAEFLKQVCEVLQGREDVRRVSTQEVEARFKSILLGALGELVQVCNRIVSKYPFTPSETETLKKNFSKVTPKQLRCLEVLYDIIGT